MPLLLQDLLVGRAESPTLLLCADTAIKDNMLFSGLPPAGLAAIIDSMQPQMATAGKEIIKQVGFFVTRPRVV